MSPSTCHFLPWTRCRTWCGVVAVNMSSWLQIPPQGGCITVCLVLNIDVYGFTLDNFVLWPVCLCPSRLSSAFVNKLTSFFRWFEMWWKINITKVSKLQARCLRKLNLGTLIMWRYTTLIILLLLFAIGTFVWISD